MNYQEFINNVKNAVSDQIGKVYSIELKSIKKNNGYTLDGLVIKNPSINIAPTIYLNQYYHRYLDGQSLSDILTDIINTFENVMPKEDINLDFFVDYNQVKNKIIMKLINFDKNKDLLEDVPYVHYLDFAIIFQVLVYYTNDETGTILIHNSHINAWNITVNELYEAAKNNAPKLIPVKTFTLSDFPKLIVITNKYSNNGASVICYPDTLKKLASAHESDLIIIPSSIHEIIAVPVVDDADINHYSEMVKEVNSTALADDEYLSDHAYYYSLARDQII